MANFFKEYQKQVKVDKLKLKKIYDWDNEVAGYKLGDYYLMKHYYWGNEYQWIINKTGESYYHNYEKGDYITVRSFKDGKAKLIALATE